MSEVNKSQLINWTALHTEREKEGDCCNCYNYCKVKAQMKHTILYSCIHVLEIQEKRRNFHS